ncbi:MAG: DUF3783 domain-containing protein [Lachnospiraceae bacterium]|nr:DUF3783 domain-containing protein [Lachnospiraceae bacterium]
MGINNKLIIATNLDTARLNALLSVCGPLGISVKTIDSSKYRKSMGSLAGIPGISALAKEDEDCPVEMEMIVFCGVDDETLDAYLDSSRDLGFKQVELKAVLTPVNITWSFRKLYSELFKENQCIPKI